MSLLLLFGSPVEPLVLVEAESFARYTGAGGQVGVRYAGRGESTGASYQGSSDAPGTRYSGDVER